MPGSGGAVGRGYVALGRPDAAALAVAGLTLGDQLVPNEAVRRTVDVQVEADRKEMVVIDASALRCDVQRHCRMAEV